MKIWLSTIVALLLLAGCQSTAPAAPASQIARVRTAAIEIASVQKSKGNDGALKVIFTCYKRAVEGTLLLAEECATQDYVISKASIAFLSQLGQVGKSNYSYKIARDAPDRIMRLLISKGMNPSEVSQFIELLKTDAFPAFVKARSASR